MIYTAQQGRDWFKRHPEAKTIADNSIPGILRPLFLSSDRLRQTVYSGRWVWVILKSQNRPIELFKRIALCSGKRSVCEDPWEVAASYLNEIERTGTISDVPDLGGAIIAESIKQYYRTQAAQNN